MGLVDRVAWAYFERLRHGLMSAAAEPAKTQEGVLADLVQRAADTEWGRDHDYGAIRSVADFQRRVPLCRFDDVRPLWARIQAGEPNVTWPGHTRYFALSAGTTAGSKHVPVTADAIASNKRSGACVVALTYHQMGRTDVTKGRFLYLGGSTALRREGQAFIGDASGIMNANVPRLARRYHLPEPDIAALTDWEEKVDRMCHAYLATRVHVAAGLPSWLVPLFERLIEVGRERLRSRVETAGDVWPHCGAVLSYGMAIEPYRPTLERLVGRPVCYIDTYSSSEGGMNAIQDRQDEPGMLLLVNNGVFYEFVQPDADHTGTPRRLTVADVEPDVPYEVILSTNGGIWAYRMGDVVRFVSLNPHRVLMTGRTSHRLSAFGEHLIGEELEAGIIAACRATGAEVTNFAVQAVYPLTARKRTPEGGCATSRGVEQTDRRESADGTAATRGRHRWHCEFRSPPHETQAFMDAVDGRLKELNEDYASYRKGDLALGPPELVALAPGAFYEWMKQRGRLGGQYKIPRVLTDPAGAERLRAVSEDLATGP